jgi:hypothetical protein
MAVWSRQRSRRQTARREWARRETPDLVLGIRRRFVEALAFTGGATSGQRYERAVQMVVHEVKVELLRHTGNLDLALHAGKRTKEICLETARGLQRA